MSKRIFRSRETRRRVILRWETATQVGIAFTDNGPTYRCERGRFYKIYQQV